jgi:hypothetical protein
MLSKIPWGDVIKAAPEVAGTARRFWDSVKKEPVQTVDVTPEKMIDPEIALTARLEQAEARVADLHSQMLSASEVISTLAQQNAKLVEQTESLRKRLMQLGLITGALSVIAIGLAVTALLVKG